MGKWTKVTPTTLPIPGERVILCVDGHFVGEGWLRENKKDWVRYDELLTVEEIFHRPVSHWMPMPAPPGGDHE